MFAHLFSRWSIAVKLLKPQNFKLFLLVALNTARRALVLLGGYFWWLYALMVLMTLIAHHVAVSPLAILIHFIIFLVTLLAVRTSTEPKDFNYFMSYLLSLRTVALFLLWLSAFSLYCGGIIVYSCSALSMCALGLYLLWFISLFFLPYISLCAFFLLDDALSPRALYNALYRSLLFIINFMPICFVFGVIGAWAYQFLGLHTVIPYAFNFAHHTFLTSLGEWLWIILMVSFREIIKIFFLSCMCMLYVKMKHDNYNLFFPRK